MKALRLISTNNLEHSDWLDVRRTGIGGSDIAAICGLSRYKSPMEVYLDKLGEIPPIEDNPKMKAGRKLEPVIAEWFAEESGEKVIKQNAIFQHPDKKFMLANIDRWLLGKNEGLEIKNGSEYVRDDWYPNNVPVEYVLQGNWYMATLNADRWWFAVLLGGWDFQIRMIERDDTLIKNLMTIGERFWVDNVLAKVPPAFSHQDSDYLKDKYRAAEAESWLDLPEGCYPIMEQLYEAKKAKDNALVMEEMAKNQIKGLMGNKEKAFWQGELKFTWKANKNNVRAFKTIGGND